MGVAGLLEDVCDFSLFCVRSWCFDCPYICESKCPKKQTKNPPPPSSPNNNRLDIVVFVVIIVVPHSNPWHKQHRKK